jgi:hypothetical protein
MTLKVIATFDRVNAVSRTYPCADHPSRFCAMRTWLHLCLALMCLGFTSYVGAGSSQAVVDAALMLGEKGHLRIVVKNKGPKPIRLLDAREGAATCASIWIVEIQTADGQRLTPMMWYQPGDLPYEVTIEPGGSYERIIQPLAYVQRPVSRYGLAKGHYPLRCERAIQELEPVKPQRS